MKGISLFASAGIAELYLKELGINIVVANELLEKRAECHKFLHPDTDVVVGDIRNKDIKDKIIQYIKNDDIKFLLATPPCQGLSTLGKNKNQQHFEEDERNFLIFDTLEIIDYGDFDFILIENVPRFLEMYFPFQKKLYKLIDILNIKYSDKYNIDADILDTKDFCIPQMRPRAIIKLYKKNISWSWPEKQKKITLRDAIGHLPSLEAGESSEIPWHYAKEHNERQILALKHTPTGKSAMKNEIYYPKKENGERIKGFHNTFKRMSWDMPAHARTTNCGNIGSHNNVHPGYDNGDGTFSDARVLTLLETFIVSSIPTNIKFPDWATDTFIRTVIGESVPPLLIKKVLEKLYK